MTDKNKKEIHPAAINDQGYLRGEIETTRRLVDETQFRIDVSRRIAKGGVEPDTSAGEEPQG